MATLNNPAFPIHNDTYVGIAADTEVRAFGLVHGEEAGTLTVTKGDGTTVDIQIQAGCDVNVEGCLSVTSTARVWVS
jgi:hypothetical protein